jgi:thymidylate synthase (FAD)
MWTDELTLKQTAYVQRQLAQAYANSMYVYKALVRKGIPKEIARYALPEMTTTRVIVTANLRAWRDFLSKRLPKAAQSEIRMLAHLIYRHIQVYCPSAVRGLKVSK